MNLTPTWGIVLAAKPLNKLVLPCDIPSFIAYYKRHRGVLPVLVVGALVKEPGALVKLEAVASRNGSNLEEAADFRQCWLTVLGQIVNGDEQRAVELRQLNRRRGSNIVPCARASG